jgi:hypothetical protein
LTTCRSTGAAARLFSAAGVDLQLRGWKKASDHAPTWIELDEPPPARIAARAGEASKRTRRATPPAGRKRVTRNSIFRRPVGEPTHPVLNSTRTSSAISRAVASGLSIAFGLLEKVRLGRQRGPTS